MDPTASTSAPTTSTSRPRATHNLSHTNRSCQHCQIQYYDNHESAHSSPRSAALPSPPDSPSLDPYTDADLDSLSSFPSVSSSIFFSSGTGSPHSHPYLHTHPSSQHEDGYGHEQGRGHDAGLIIPSLTLPSALPQPTAYGQTLGELNLLIVGPAGGGKTSLAEAILDCDDIVDVGEWEDVEGARLLRASTDWIEERDPHGLERFEGTANVSVLELDGFSTAENPGHVVESVLRHVQDAFRDVRSQLDNSPASPLLHSLLASSHSPLYTTLIYVTATPLTQQDNTVISALASKIPIIPICTTSLSSAFSFSHLTGSPPQLANFHPLSHLALRTGLFHAPHTLAALRTEAADRFMRWREAERVVEECTKLDSDPERSGTSMLPALSRRRGTLTQGLKVVPEKEWSKAVWETMLSEDVARRLCEERKKEDIHYFGEKEKEGGESSLRESALFGTGIRIGSGTATAPCFAPVLDPLHLRSLMMLSFSLLLPSRCCSSPISARMNSLIRVDGSTDTVYPSSDSASGKGRGRGGGRQGWNTWRWGLITATAIVGVFCAGVGIGLVLST